ncbi:MAG: hypothetical protein R3193_16050 [Marinobacter sp.]|nr:hypothetical protein [Marinobacter sp.]
MSRKHLQFLAIVAMSLLLNACSVIETDVGRNFFPTAKALLAENGEPFAGEVLDALGPPHQLSKVSGGYAFLYQYIEIDEFQVGFSSSKSVLRFFKVSLARSTADIKTAVFQFDHAGAMIAADTRQAIVKIGDNGALSLAIVVAPVVDSETYEQGKVDAEQWGMALLDSSALARDRASNLDFGEGGFELRGSPIYAGQRTLEYWE